ncbi:Cilia- and flagella-associated protein 20 [Actinomortierella wolfii]|nr:Cilia- and flagella-associated protein 20 [Actinomortierella wolfii]
MLISIRSDPLQLWATRVGPPTQTKTSGSTAPPKKRRKQDSDKGSNSDSDDDDKDSEASEEGMSAPLPDPHVQFVSDDTLNSQVLELLAPNLSNTFITTPSLATRTLGIKLPFLVFLVKNLGKYWSFEITILDDRGEKRRFRASNFQSITRVKPFITTMPLRMDPGWNQIQLNLADFTKRAYGTTYVETLRVTIHANCRLRRVYFSDRIVPEEDLPAEFKLFLPIVKQM